MVGTRYEQGGIIKDGAKLINAVSNSTVPHLTLMVGASYGAGNYAMAGRAYDPRFVFTWPNHRIAVMGPKQLAGVLSIVRRNAAEAAGRPFDEAADEELRQATESQIEEESTAQYATGRLWDDGIIDPRDTRTVLAIALTAVHSAPVQGHGRLRGGAALMAPDATPIRRVLVANRGEIARRVIRGAHDAGCEAVAVYAADDAASPYVGEADAAVPLPGATLAETYLEPGRARRRGAGAGRRRPAPGLRLPLREPRPARGVRRGRHRVGRAAARGDAGHGPQGAGEGGGGRRRRPGAAERRRGRRRHARCAARRRAERRLPAPGQGLGRGRGPGDAPGATSRASWPRRWPRRSGRPPPRSAPTTCSWSATSPRRATSRSRSSGTPRHRAAPARPGVLGAAPASEGGRGGAGRPRARVDPAPDVGGGGGGGAGRRLRGRPSDLCEELGLRPTVFYRWQKEFFENGAAAFQAQERPHRQVEEKQKRIEFLEKKVQTKDEVLAELMAEHIALKKSLGEL